MDFLKDFLRFSVIIPTRNRPETLKYALLSCINQDYKNFEIILCDNSTNEETKKIFNTFNSTLIRYYRAPKSLAMSDNWELGLSFGTGDYFIVIGDDDALLPGCLHKINTTLKKNHFKAFRWDHISYFWPSLTIKELANRLTINVSKPVYQIVNGNETIQAILDQKLGYERLPMLYNSAISRELIEELKQKTGRVFNASSPDIYSGFAFALLAKEYGSTSFPLSINAGSAKSNGINHIAVYGQNEVNSDFKKLLDASDYKWPPEVPELKSLTCVNMESFVQLMNKFPNSKSTFKYSLKKIIINTIREIEIRTNSDWEEAYLKIENAIKNHPIELKWFKTTYKISEPQFKEETKYSWRVGLNYPWLFIDASKFNATDVYSVSLLCQEIIGNQYSPGSFASQGTKKNSILSRIISRLKLTLKVLLKGHY